MSTGKYWRGGMVCKHVQFIFYLRVKPSNHVRLSINDTCKAGRKDDYDNKLREHYNLPKKSI